MNAVAHSLTKAGLFFVSGVILAAYKTKQISEVKGLFRRLPITGTLWLAGFFLVTGMPASGIFLGKLMILKAAMAGGHYDAAVAYLFFLAVVFAGLGRIFLEMTFGEAPQSATAGRPQGTSRQLLVPAACFFVCVIILGLYMPGWLSGLIASAQSLVGAPYDRSEAEPPGRLKTLNADPGAFTRPPPNA